MNNQVKDNFYDFVFIGLGASNGLILNSLTRKGLLKNKRVAVFESDAKTNNDKTYCFWAKPDEAIVTELDAIISYKFTKIRVNAAHAKSIERQPYCYIRSIDLYDLTFKILEDEGIEVFRLVVDGLRSHGSMNTLSTSGGTYQAKFVFDSRPPKIGSTLPGDIYLHQSFYGLHIKCLEGVFDPDTFEMMNFNVDQHDYTQFMYVIPFSDTEALVELTRFGAERIDLEYAAAVLDDFITKSFGHYQTIGEEVGCIPMTTYFNLPSSHQGVLRTGASANLIKPSTGYGFKSMFYFAEKVAKRIASDSFENFNTTGMKTAGRFEFYDKLLLIILLRWPWQGKRIFSSLFQKLPILTIFRFLDEKSSITQEIKIFSSLPFMPFIRALLVTIKAANGQRYLLAFVTVIAYHLLGFYHPDIAGIFMYVALVAGMLWIGIPHGALDHLLSQKSKSTSVSFVLKYLSIVALYFVFWQISPLLSLVLFIAYSSFHFGESELIQSMQPVSKPSDYLEAFLVGLAVLLFIISTHLEESLQIISSVNSITVAEGFQNWSMAAALLSFAYLLFQTWKSSSWSNLGLIFLLILGVQVPLMLAFGLYFILQHSFNAWGHLQRGLELNSLQLHKKASLFTAGALVIFIAMAIYARGFEDLTDLWANFFIFIACISLPHFVMMHLFYRKRAEVD